MFIKNRKKHLNNNYLRVQKFGSVKLMGNTNFKANELDISNF